MEPGSSPPSRVVSALVAAGLLPSERAADAEAVVAAALGSGGHGRRAGVRLAEVAGYLGAALVVAAVGLVLATSWSELSDTAQVAALATITVLLTAAGMVLARVGGGYAQLRNGRDELRRRLTSAVLTAAALAGAVTAALSVELWIAPGSAWATSVGGATLAVLAAAAYPVAASALGQVAMASGAVAAVLYLLAALGDGPATTLVPGLSLLTLGVLWAGLAEVGAFREVLVARLVGVALTLGGAQVVVFDHAVVSYALTAAVAVAGFLLYLRTVSWPYLVAGVLGVTLVVPEAVMDWTDGSLGIAGGVLVAGLTLLGASLAGLRVRRETTD